MFVHRGSVAALALVLVATLGLVRAHAATQPAPATLSLAATLRSAGQPFDIALDPASNRAFVTDVTENVLYVFDLSTGAPLAFVPTGRQPNHVVLLGSRAYVSNFGDGSTTVVDTKTLAPLETLAIGGLGLAADPKSGRLYAAACSRIFVLDTATDKLIATIAAPSGANLWGLALDASAGRLYATDIANPRVLVFDTTTDALAARIPIDAPARFAIAVGPLGQVFVASYLASGAQVSEIDGASATVSAAGPIGAFTTALALDSSSVLYAVSPADGTISAVSTSSFATLSRASLSGSIGGVALLPTSGGVVAATSGGDAPPARAFVTPVPVVRP